jgi:flagella basal body P-ring formation protein FlgA
MRNRNALAGCLLATLGLWSLWAVAGDGPMGQMVTAAQIVTAARAEMEARSAQARIPVTLELSGRVADVFVPWSGQTRLIASPANDWLRPRVAVPVTVADADGHSRHATVWFVVHAPVTGPVYKADAARATLPGSIQIGEDIVDRAKTRGFDPTWRPDPASSRLRRAVHAGQPVLATDFEPVPTVAAGQTVSIESRQGAVRLLTSGRALADGQLGQTIRVLPAVSPQPIQARVVATGKVSLEN